MSEATRRRTLPPRRLAPSRAVGAVVVLLTCLAALGLVVLGPARSPSDADLRVNLSGRQRMLTERVSNEILLAQASTGRQRTAALARAATAARVLTRTERALSTDGEVLGLDGEPTGEVLSASDASRGRARAGLVAQVERYVAQSREPRSLLRVSRELRPRLVSAEDAATATEQTLAGQSRAAAQRQLSGVLLLVLVLGVSAAVLLARQRARAESRDRQQGAEATFRALVIGSPDGLVVLDTDGVPLYMSPACQTLDLDPERPEETWAAWLDTASADELRSVVCGDGEPASVLELLTRSGRRVRARLRDGHDSPDLGGTVVHLQDVTEEVTAGCDATRREAVVRLMQEAAIAANSSASLDEALQAVLDGVCRHFRWRIGHAWVVPADGGPLRSTRLWAGTGFQSAALAPRLAAFRARTETMTVALKVGLPGRVWSTAAPHWVSDLAADANFPRAADAKAAGLASAAAFPLLLGEEVVAILEFFDAQVLARDEEVLEVMGHLGSLLGRVAERLRAERRLLTQARTDEVTGLDNRRSLRESLVARLTGRFTTVSVVYLDLDDFKDVNDTLGHEVGDRVLAEVALRLRATVSPGDQVARIGGDEFALVVEDSAAGVEAIVEKVLLALAEPIVLEENRQVTLRASVGFATATLTDASSRPVDRADQLLVEADIALYASKSGETPQVVRFDVALGEDLQRRKRLDAGLRHALSEESFELVFQPIVATVDQRLLAVEALLRCPDVGVGPDVFVPHLEITGLIVPVGRWVLDRACAVAAEWTLDGFDGAMSVNVSPMQLATPGFADDVASILAASGLPAERLIIEITESVATDDGAFAVLNALAATGIRIAVDDFGSGWSSLSQLMRSPASYLKIDRSLVEDVDTRAGEHLVRAILSLAASRGMDVVAEGVETQAQLDVLTRIGCGRVQGYLTGRPAPLADLAVPARPALPRGA